MQNAQSAASKANGALMRATPLAIWAHRLPAEAIAAAAAADARLSHPNQATQDANAAYVIALASLIRLPGDAAAALAAAEGWAAEHACSEVQQWLAAAADESDMQHYQATALIGFVKHAFQLAFYHLRRRSGFVEGLRHTLLAGGDTGEGLAAGQLRPLMLFVCAGIAGCRGSVLAAGDNAGERHAAGSVACGVSCGCLALRPPCAAPSCMPWSALCAWLHRGPAASIC